MTNEKIYQLVLKYSYLFEQTPNILDLITVQINKLWDWEYGGRFRKFTNDDDSKFAIMLYLHRKGYSYDQIINKIKNSTAIILGYDNEERVLEACGECDGSGNEICNECDGNGDEMCYSCDGDGETDCYNCDGRGNVETDVMGYDEFYDKVYTTNKLGDMDDDHPFEERYYNSLVLKQPSLRERNFRETYSMEDIKYDWNVGNQIDDLDDRNFVFFGGKLLL